MPGLGNSRPFFLILNTKSMARIKFSGLVTEIRGSAGGTTFQSNAYGWTAKNKANMIRPNSTYQEECKAAFMRAASSWATLTDVQRQSVNSWATSNPQYAKNNPESILSGFAVWVRYWATRLNFNKTWPIAYFAPAASPPAIDTVTFTCTLIAGVLSINANFVIGTGLWSFGYWLSPPTTGSRLFPGSTLRKVGFVTNEDDNLTSAASYTARFGRLPEVGDWINLKYLFFDENSYYMTHPEFARVQVAGA